MTLKEWQGCMHDLTEELDAAEASGDQDRILGTAMAIDAFLAVVRMPPPDPKPSKRRARP